MNNQQITYIQQIILEFLRTQLIEDISVNKEEANTILHEIDLTLDTIKTEAQEKQIAIWLDFFKVLMLTRVYFYEKAFAESQPFIFCAALSAVHRFLWDILQQSALNDSLKKASEEALAGYSLFFHPIFFRQHNQDYFEKERIKVAALNNEHILNNTDEKNKKAPFLIKKIYPDALYQHSHSSETSLLFLKNKWRAFISMPISQEDLMHAQLILIEFLTNQEDADQSCINEVNKHFGQLIANQTSSDWINLLSYLIQSHIKYCSDDKSFWSFFTTKPTIFGDALKAVHACLLKMIMPTQPDNSCNAPHFLTTAKICADDFLKKLLDSRSSSNEAIKAAQLRCAALGDNAVLNSMATLKSDSASIDAWATELQGKLKTLNSKRQEETAEPEVKITDVSTTLHSMKNEPPSAEKKIIRFSPDAKNRDSF